MCARNPPESESTALWKRARMWYELHNGVAALSLTSSTSLQDVAPGTATGKGGGTPESALESEAPVSVAFCQRLMINARSASSGLSAIVYLPHSSISALNASPTALYPL